MTQTTTPPHGGILICAPETAPNRGRPRPMPARIRRTIETSWLTYRRGKRTLTCLAVTTRSAPGPCEAMERLRELVRLHAPAGDPASRAVLADMRFDPKSCCALKVEA